MRSKIDALVDLGEKVTGKPIQVTDKDLMLYNEDITEVLDEITKNYEGGGSTSEEIVLEGELSWLQGGTFYIDNEEDVAKLKNYEELALARKNPRLCIHFSEAYYGLEYNLSKTADLISTHTVKSPLYPDQTGFTAVFSYYVGSDQAMGFSNTLFDVTVYRAYNINNEYTLTITPISLGQE